MNRIRELREDKDLRQSDVSQITGIDQRTLSNYETGKTNPDSFAIIKLAEFFEVSTDYLLGVADYNYYNSQQILKEISDIQTRLDNLSDFIKKQINSKSPLP